MKLKISRGEYRIDGFLCHQEFNNQWIFWMDINAYSFLKLDTKRGVRKFIRRWRLTGG